MGSTRAEVSRVFDESSRAFIEGKPAAGATGALRLQRASSSQAHRRGVPRVASRAGKMIRPTRDDIAFARKHRKGQARGRGGSLVGLRVAELERLFRDRWGEALPDDDAGRDDLLVLLNHAAWYRDARAQMFARAATWAPWLPTDALDDMIADISARPLRWRADKLAERLGVDDATRTRLALRTIGAMDSTAAQRRARRKERDRLAKEAKRRAAGVPARETNRETLARQTPWRALGISRRTWFRRRRGTGGTTASAAYRYLYVADAAVPRRWTAASTFQTERHFA